MMVHGCSAESMVVGQGKRGRENVNENVLEAIGYSPLGPSPFS